MEKPIIWRVERWDGISIFCKSESDAKNYIKLGNKAYINENIFPMTAKEVANILYKSMNHPDDIFKETKNDKR